MKEREDEWKEEGGERSQLLLMNRRKETATTKGSQHFVLTLKRVQNTHMGRHTHGGVIVFSSAELSQKLPLCCYFIVIVMIQ